MAQNNSLVAKYAMKNDSKAEILHSSGFAASQSGGNMGAAAGESFAERQALEQKRKFVRKYNNSRIMNEFYGVERAKTYVPRTGKYEEKAGRDARRYSRGNDADPMGKAMERARMSSGVGSASSGKTGAAAKAKPVLGAAKAPAIPSRRGGI